MDQHRFDTIVSRLESYAQRHPRLYKLRVAILAAWGYAFIFFLLAASLAIVAAVVFLAITTGLANVWIFLLGIPASIFAFLLARATWTTMPRPQGVHLRRQDAPLLFQTVDHLRKSLRCPKIHHLLLSDDFNASIVQLPRLGILGWQERFLILGFPLLLSLSPDQASAVIAHELGHLSHNHGRFGSWIYRIEKTWSQVLASFNENKRLPTGIPITRFGIAILHRFFRFYSPYFAAYSFVMRRANEFTADRAAADATSPALAARTTLWIAVQSHRLDQYWKQVFTTTSHEHPSPPDDPFVEFVQATSLPLAQAELETSFRKVCRRKTTSTDTHPSISDRIAALGFPITYEDLSIAIPPDLFPAAPATNSAEQFLGPYLPTARQRISTLWRDHVLSNWVQRHNRVKQQLAELEKLQALALTRPLKDEEAWNRVYLTRECWGADQANPLALDLHQASPTHAGNNYALGQSLLNDRDDPAGVDYLLKSMDKDSEAILPACQTLIAYYTRTGQTDHVRTYQTRHQDRVKTMQLARLERARLYPSDQYTPHDWPIEKIQPLVDQLRQYKKIRRAYLACKKVRHIPDIPCLVLIIEPITRGIRINNKRPPHFKLRRQLAARLQFPKPVLIFLLSPMQSALHAVQGVPNACIYQKPPKNPAY